MTTLPMLKLTNSNSLLLQYSLISKKLWYVENPLSFSSSGNYLISVSEKELILKIFPDGSQFCSHIAYPLLQVEGKENIIWTFA